MVTAGVYLVVRVHEVFVTAPDTLHAVGTIGAITSLFAYSGIAYAGFLLIPLAAEGEGAVSSMLFYLVVYG